MMDSSWVQLISDLGRKYGNLGLLPNGPSLCVLLPTIVAGLLIV
jgi:hypothetical protein